MQCNCRLNVASPREETYRREDDIIHVLEELLPLNLWHDFDISTSGSKNVTKLIQHSRLALRMGHGCVISGTIDATNKCVLKGGLLSADGVWIRRISPAFHARLDEVACDLHK